MQGADGLGGKNGLAAATGHPKAVIEVAARAVGVEGLQPKDHPETLGERAVGRMTKPARELRLTHE